MVPLNLGQGIQAGDVVIVGSVNMDLVLQVEHLPRPGETLKGKSFHTVPGGKGANQAAAAAKLGGTAAMVGCIGDDDFGSALRRNLVTAGVDDTFLYTRQGTSSGVALVAVESSGENSIVIVGGANDALDPATVDKAASLLLGAKVVLLQLESPIESVIRAAELAAQGGAWVVLDPAPAPQEKLPLDLIASVSVVTPNQSEAAMLVGCERVDRRNAAAVARKIAEMGFTWVLLKLGADGVLVFGEGVSHLIPGHEVDVTDTTAAGDVFNGALAVALAAGLDMIQAAEVANCAGALAVTRLGAQSSIPDSDEVAGLWRRSRRLQT